MCQRPGIAFLLAPRSLKRLLPQYLGPAALHVYVVISAMCPAEGTPNPALLSAYNAIVKLIKVAQYPPRLPQVREWMTDLSRETPAIEVRTWEIANLKPRSPLLPRRTRRPHRIVSPRKDRRAYGSRVVGGVSCDGIEAIESQWRFRVRDQLVAGAAAQAIRRTPPSFPLPAARVARNYPKPETTGAYVATAVNRPLDGRDTAREIAP